MIPVADTEPLADAGGAADDIEHEQAAARPEKDELGRRAKKRIGELTWKAHEAERRAQVMEQRNRMLEAKLQEVHGSANTFYTQNLENEISTAEGEYAKAVNEGDALAQAKALRKLSEATSKKSAATQWQQPQPQQQQQPEPAQQQSSVSPKMQGWLEENPWYLNDRVMAQAALAVHQDVVRKGVQPESDEYFGIINKRMRAAFPDSFEDDPEETPTAAPPKPAPSKPTASAAPVHRTAAAPTRPTTGRLPKLSAEQQSVARMLGISDDAYAAQLPRN